MVMGGCLTFIVAPDEEPVANSRVIAPGRFPVVILDPGHGGKDDGARANGLVEKELTLDLANRASKILQEFGFQAVLTRNDDTFLSLPERAAIANRTEDSIMVSIHFNHASATSSTGVETFYASEKVPPESAWTWAGFFIQPKVIDTDNGEALAGFLQSSMVDRTQSSNRGIKGRPLYVVRHTRGPAALVECGFITNLFEAQLIANSEYRDRLAKAIAEGVMSYTKSRPRPATLPSLAQASR
jgi:N-acetylmuramoyl-L-alanine amidase